MNEKTDMQAASVDPVVMLPCPFCSGEPYQRYSDIHLGILTGCENEDCEFQPYCRSAQRKSGVKAWNKRAT